MILINNQNANKPGNSEHNKVSSSLNPESNVGSRAKEMEAELKSLRDQTRKLKEEKEDLQAQVIKFWPNLEIVMNELRKNQNFHFDLQIHPTLLNSTYLHCQMTGYISIRVQNF